MTTEYQELPLIKLETKGMKVGGWGLRDDRVDGELKTRLSDCLILIDYIASLIVTRLY
jgi:hypothetical protein